ncbi:hypothetical protein F2P56_012812, partial [Juglans regia]
AYFIWSSGISSGDWSVLSAYRSLALTLTLSLMAAIRSVVMGEPSLSPFPQHQVSAPDTTPVPFPVQPLPPFAAPSTSSGIPEQLMHKNRLQEYAQRSAISLPWYCTTNEGSQHAPQFRSTVTVDGEIYTSPNTFSHRKAAEQDVAKLALENILQKIKDEGCPLIHQDADCYLAGESSPIVFSSPVNKITCVFLCMYLVWGDKKASYWILLDIFCTPS